MSTPKPITGLDFADAVAKACRLAVEKSGSQHPEDVMCQVMTVTEAIYELTGILPAGAWNYAPHGKPSAE